MAPRSVTLTLALSLITSCWGATDKDETPAASGGSGTTTTPGGAGGSASLYVDIIRAPDGCLPRSLPVNEDEGSLTEHQLGCSILEAVPGDGSTCDCIVRGKMATLSAEYREAGRQKLEQTGWCGETSGIACENVCFCELEQLGDESLRACQYDVDPGELLGFCYIDLSIGLGEPALVADCPESMQRKLRFLDPSGNTPAPGGTLLIACSG